MKETMVTSIKSKDGTTIAFDKEGHGPALILVNGAMSTRSDGLKPELAKLLAQHFTVYAYDRRGRGDSGDTKPYAVGPRDRRHRRPHRHSRRPRLSLWSLIRWVSGFRRNRQAG